MKTFSDSNSTIEQERRKDAVLAMRVELLRQYDSLIVSRDSATEITVAGDATALFVVGDTMVIPLQSFPTNHVLTSITYSAMDDETAIVCSASNFPATGLPNLQVAKRYIVSGGNVERMIEMSSIKFDLEGETLNSWLASDVDFRFDNGDGFFANSAGNGLFDGVEVMWVRVYFGWKRATDRVLYFGGIVELDTIKDDRYARTFTITVFGHLKELERYPAWLISEPNGDFLKLSGIEIIGITANDQTSEGIKNLGWKFIEGGIPGVEILSLSKTVGNFDLVPLKFRFPNLFKYAWGDWIEVAENTATSDLTGADGSTLMIKTTNYDVRDREIFLQIVADLNPRVNKTGVLELNYDNGAPIRINSDFDTVVIDAGSTTFTDESNNNDREGITYETLQASDATIYLFADMPFYGIEAFLESSDLIGTLRVAFSNGFNSWQTFSVTDGTSNFTQNGVITWTQAAVNGWRPITFEDAAIDAVTQKFGLRIDLSAYTSGSAILRSLRRYFKAFAADGTELAFKVDFHNLTVANTDEDLIIRQIGGVWTPCTWYRNITIQTLVEKIFTAANYGAGSYTLDDLKITNDSPVISIIGQAPEPFYSKKAKALLWDSGNEILYLGIGNELWSVTETGDFTYLDALDKINENADGYGMVELSIRSLALDSGDIHGMAWWDQYDDMREHLGDFADAGFYIWFFKSDGNSITEILQASGGQQISAPQYINPCEQMMRQGNINIVGPDKFSVIGQNTPESYAAGENLIIPFPQIVRNFYLDESPNFTGQFLFDVEGLLSGNVATTDAFYFSKTLTSASGKNGPFFRALNNLFMMSFDFDALSTNSGWINFRWQLGNPGLAAYESGDGFIVLQTQRDNATWTDTHHRIVKISTDQALTEIYDLSDSLKQPLCGFILGGHVFFSFMFWDDDGTDLSKCILAKVNLSDSTYTALFDFGTDSAEASQSITGDEDYQTILDMAIIDVEDEIHGCLLNRDNFEYHYFVFDRFNGKMYSTQTGANFTFDKHRQFKNFVYFDGKVYSVCVDTRYQTGAAFLVEATFNAGTITLTQISIIDQSDSEHLTMIATDDALFGVTGKGLLWKYSTTFYPRVSYANLGDRDMREVLNDTVQVLNRVITARADRTLRVVTRDNYDGTKSLYDDKHIVSLQPLEPWEHFYDRVEVSWRDPVSGQNGIESYGTDGWQRRILKMSNPLIQNRHLAKVIATQYHTFFNQARKIVPAELTALLELEEYDRVKFILNTTQTDLLRDDYYLLTGIEFDQQNMLLKIKGLN